MIHKKIPPIHPGEILAEEFLEPFGLTQYRLARDIKVSPRRINEIVHGTRALTADTALRLEKYFGTSAQFWLNLQTQYDLAQEIDHRSKKINREVKEYSPVMREIGVMV